jgi:dienelactone hydrolase
MGRRRRQRISLAGLAALALALAGCEPSLVAQVNELRADAGRASLPTSDPLASAAREHSRDMCAAGSAQASPSAYDEYDQETARGVKELVGSAALDPSVSDPVARNVAASNAIWAGWKDDSALVDARWDDLAVGEASCQADGRLYATAVLRDAPSMPASGLYSTPQYAAADVQVLNAQQYGQAVNEQGQNQALLLDLYLPPGATPAARPTVVLIHGGGFVGGSRGSVRTDALSWARRGYVAAGISYRLGTVASVSADLLAVAGRAIDDAMESVRWLKSNAATYRIDPAKIAAVGFSAGGAISLGVALADDQTPAGPLSAFSPKVAAAVSTGAHLTPALGTGAVTFEPGDAAVMLFHYETDSTTRASDEYAFETCAAVREGGNTCDFISQPGSGHTTWLEPGGTWWAPKVGPFVWTQLGLG